MGEHGRPPIPSKSGRRYVRVGVCLYRQTSDGALYFKGQINGREFTHSLGTKDRALALRRLADFRRDRERLEVGADQVTLAALAELYRASLSKSLKPHTLSIKERRLNFAQRLRAVELDRFFSPSDVCRDCLDIRKAIYT
jgi:hypothetical protein